MKIFLTSIFIYLITIYQSNAQSVSEIKDSTLDLLASFSESQMQEVLLPFETVDRTQWTNLPVGLAPRKGLRFGDFTAESKIKFHRLLTQLLSSQGYLKTFAILQLDDILHEIFEIAYENGEMNENAIEGIRGLNWDYGNYYLAIWGNPKTASEWGLKFEGHHLSLNLSVAGEKYSMTPLFLGSDPAEVNVTQYAGLRPLSKEEDYGFLLINSLDENQKKKAILSREVPGDILTAPGSEQRLDDYMGIPASLLDEKQQKLLHYIIEEFIGNLEKGKKEQYITLFHAIDKKDIYFAWIGELAPKNPHYYQINTPMFLIEYDNVGFQKNGNHIHAIWREKGNDFGEDILKKHRLSHRHE